MHSIISDRVLVSSENVGSYFQSNYLKRKNEWMHMIILTWLPYFRSNGTRQQEHFVLTKKVSGHVTVHVWAWMDAKENGAIHRIRERHTAATDCEVIKQVSCLMFPWASKVRGCGDATYNVLHFIVARIQKQD